MKILLCEPGASYSVMDVANGYRRAFEALGVEVVRFTLDSRIERAGSWLLLNWKRARRAGQDLPRPTAADVAYQAGSDLILRALRFNVDGVVLMSGMYLHPDLIVMLRRAKLHTALVLTESPYDDDAQLTRAPYVDVLFTNERATLAQYQAINPDSYYLPHAYDPSQIEAATLEEDVPNHDVVFVGTGFQERIDLLGEVDWTGIDLGLYGHWDLLPSRHRIRQYIHGGVQDNARTIALYQHAKIGLNLYRESIGFGRKAPRLEVGAAESLNPRAYELAAAGCFQLASERQEGWDWFAGGMRVFRDARELADEARLWLANDGMRQEVVEKARRFVQGHTYAARAARVLERLEAVWFGRAPPGPDRTAVTSNVSSETAALSFVR